MMSQGEDVEIHALRQQGWSISAIARHVGRDRKTVRAVRGFIAAHTSRPNARHSGVRAARRFSVGGGG